MRILSTLDELDPLPMLGERLATPRIAPELVAPQVKHDWTRCTPSDLEHPDAPKCSNWTEPNGVMFTIARYHIDPGARDATSVAQVKLDEKGYVSGLDSIGLHPGNCEATALAGAALSEKLGQIGDVFFTTLQQDAEITLRAQREPNVSIRCVRPAPGPVGFETLVLTNHPGIDRCVTLNQFFAIGWTSDQLVEYGYAEWVRQ